MICLQSTLCNWCFALLYVKHTYRREGNKYILLGLLIYELTQFEFNLAVWKWRNNMTLESAKSRISSFSIKSIYSLKHCNIEGHIVWFSIKVTTLNSKFLMVYSSENILFLYLHFTWLYGSWNHQRILKKHPFWKYDGWFSSEVSKPTSVKYPWNHTFSGMTKIDFHQYCPIIFISLTRSSQYCL